MVFFCMCWIDLLKKNGVECFIAQNNWISSTGASILRNKILKETKIIQFIDFGDYKIFENAGIQTMVYVLVKSFKSPIYNLYHARILDKNIKHSDLVHFLDIEYSDICFLKHFIEINSTKLLNNVIIFVENDIENLLNKIKQDTFNLEETEIAQGIVCPQEFLNIKNARKLSIECSEGEGIFVLNNDEVEKKAFNEAEKKIIKSFFTTSELHKYHGSGNSSRWIIYTRSDMNRKINSYPNIKKHLDRFKSIITSDFGPYGLHRSRKEIFFKGPKIVSLRKCCEPTFTYNDSDCYVSQTFFVIKTNRVNMKYLTGLFNSRLIAFWLRHKGKMQGNLFQIDKEPLLSIPIKKQIGEKGKLISDLVNKIIGIMSDRNFFQDKNKKSKIREIQEQIDQMVYKLYDLTDDEIKIVENFENKK